MPAEVQSVSSFSKMLHKETIEISVKMCYNYSIICFSQKWKRQNKIKVHLGDY